MQQRSPEWFAARAGKATSSRVALLTARTKSGWGASRANCIAELVAERLAGTCAEGFQSAAMAWGTEKEPEARDLYAFMKGVEVAEVGFVDHPTIEWAGASPDGLVGDDGLVEIKCPNTATHIETLRGAPIPAKYLKQMQWQMLCTDRAWCDFASYDPRMPAEMQIHIQRVEHDPDLAAELERDVSEALDEVADLVAELQEKYST